MGLFDKLNNQLEINDIKERLYEEDELKRIERRMIFEGYHPDMYLLEVEEDSNKNNSNGWASYFNSSTKRISNPWSKKMSDEEKAEFRKDREMTRNQDRLDREAIRRREDEDRADKKSRETAERYQDEYDEEFDYIKNKVVRTLKQYVEDSEFIQSKSETKPDGTVDEDKKKKKKDELNELKTNYKRIMRKLQNQYEELNHDKKYNSYVKKRKISSDYFELDASVL